MAWLVDLGKNGLSRSGENFNWYLLAGAILVFGLWEAFLPRRIIQSPLPLRLGSHLTLFLLAFGLSLIVLPSPIFAFALAMEKTRWGLWVATRIPWYVRFFASLLILDFVYYAVHIAFHSFGPLWRVHSIHHSDVDFDLTTGFRAHPLEPLMRTAAQFAVVAVVAAPAPAILVYSWVSVAHSLFAHLNVTLPRRLDRVLHFAIVTPQFHEVHHSIDLAEQKSNYGEIFPWWDRLFGTANEPPRDGASLRFGLDKWQSKPRLNPVRILVSPFVPASRAE
jgi:sterol desaturase/sphingolipid hydroxylase (fatty acid hydroxylase superfamily)